MWLGRGKDGMVKVWLVGITRPQLPERGPLLTTSTHICFLLQLLLSALLRCTSLANRTRLLGLGAWGSLLDATNGPLAHALPLPSIVAVLVHSCLDPPGVWNPITHRVAAC
jgi:hypothetical protein